MPAFINVAGGGDVLLWKLEAILFTYEGLTNLAKRGMVMKWEAGEEAAVIQFLLDQ